MMCLVLLGGVWEPIVKWRTHMFTIFTTSLSTTLYNTLLQSTALQQFYSLQPLHHPSDFTIGSQTPPNNTRHIMDTHFHHLHTFLHTGTAARR